MTPYGAHAVHSDGTLEAWLHQSRRLEIFVWIREGALVALQVCSHATIIDWKNGALTSGSLVDTQHLFTKDTDLHMDRRVDTKRIEWLKKKLTASPFDPVVKEVVLDVFQGTVKPDGIARLETFIRSLPASLRKK